MKVKNSRIYHKYKFKRNNSIKYLQKQVERIRIHPNKKYQEWMSEQLLVFLYLT